MIKTFELYFIKLFIKKILNVFLIFFTLIFILNLFEEITFFKDLEVNSFFPIMLSALNAPATLFEIFPFIFLIATQFFFLDIIDKNELEILKISGLSNLRVLRTLFLTSFVISPSNIVSISSLLIILLNVNSDTFSSIFVFYLVGYNTLFINLLI